MLANRMFATTLWVFRPLLFQHGHVPQRYPLTLQIQPKLPSSFGFPFWIAQIRMVVLRRCHKLVFYKTLFLFVRVILIYSLWTFSITWCVHPSNQSRVCISVVRVIKWFTPSFVALFTANISRCRSKMLSVFRHCDLKVFSYTPSSYQGFTAFGSVLKEYLILYDIVILRFLLCNFFWS